MTNRGFQKGNKFIFKKGNQSWKLRKNTIGFEKGHEAIGGFETRFKEGNHPKTEFKKGEEIKTAFKKGCIGDKNAHWKGGITPLYKKLRNDSLYKIWKNAVLLRDNFTCQNLNCEFCNNKMGVMLHAHHIKPFAFFPELRFVVSNGITYCEEFHINSKLLHKNLKEIA